MRAFDEAAHESVVAAPERRRGDFGAPLKLEVWEAVGSRCSLVGAAHTDLRSLASADSAHLQLSAQGKVRAAALLQ